MRRNGFKLSQIVQMVKSVEGVNYAKTSDRKVLGIMNDIIHMLKYYNMTEDELKLARKLNHIPYKRKDFSFPVEVLMEIV